MLDFSEDRFVKIGQIFLRKTDIKKIDFNVESNSLEVLLKSGEGHIFLLNS